MMARPRLSDVKTLSPASIGLNGSPVPLAMPAIVKMTNGTMTPIWMSVSDQPVNSRPRMLMKVKRATTAMPRRARVVPSNLYSFCR